jgi:hypothetical protein
MWIETASSPSGSAGNLTTEYYRIHRLRQEHLAVRVRVEIYVSSDPDLPVPLIVVTECSVWDVEVVLGTPVLPAPELEVPAGAAHVAEAPGSELEVGRLHAVLGVDVI